MDNILIGKNGTHRPQQLKSAFGLGNVSRSDDFASAISRGIAGLQSTNWDPAENGTGFGLYCSNVSSPDALYPALEGIRSDVRELIVAGGYANEMDPLLNQMLNYIGYVNSTVVAPCREKNATQDHCVTNYNTTFYQQDDLGSASWRSWAYQYCSQ